MLDKGDVDCEGKSYGSGASSCATGDAWFSRIVGEMWHVSGQKGRNITMTKAQTQVHYLFLWTLDYPVMRPVLQRN